jgi:hypothetical protein
MTDRELPIPAIGKIEADLGKTKRILTTRDGDQDMA